MPRLILINGAPGAGKTSLARRFVADHPLALLVDIDGLRTQLGQWERREESRTIARELALALAEAHLVSSRDVVVPQYVGRLQFVERLAGLADRCGADFIEIVLVTEPGVSVERFRRRRAALAVADASPPEADVRDADIEQAVHDGLARLVDICDPRPATRRVPAGADMETTYATLLATLEGPAL